MRNFRKESVNRLAIIAFVVMNMLAGGGFLVFKNTKTPASETTGEVRTDVGDRDVVFDSQLTTPPATPTPRTTDFRTRAAAAGKKMVSLEGSVPAALGQSQKIHRDNAGEDPLTLTVVLKRTDQAGFENFLRGVQDPKSASYRHYLKPREQADQFGPSAKAYDEVKAWLQVKGFDLVEGSANRLTLTVRGIRRLAGAAFRVRITDYRSGERVFYANESDPVMPAQIAAQVQAVVGLSNLASPKSSIYESAKTLCNISAQGEAQRFVQDIMTSPGNEITQKFQGPDALYKYYYNQFYKSCIANPFSYFLGKNGPGGKGGNNTAAAPIDAFSRLRLSSEASDSIRWADVDGTGQTVGLLEFDSFNVDDIKDYLELVGSPATFINRLSRVHVNGGAALGPEEAEVLIDIIAVMGYARGAKVVVYDAPFGGIKTSFQTLFNRMIGDNVTVISNSWVYCEDQSTLADAQSIDSILASAAVAGITVLNAAGDFGSTCVNGSANTVSVPADSPHATAVGGTSLTLGPVVTYGSEVFWNGLNNTQPTGQGGFGVSRFFARPVYQDGFSNSPMRSVPDVSVNADPARGIVICQADAGGCPTGSTYGGTSLAAPVWAAYVALLNQAQGQNIGQLNSLLYPLANTNAFHTAASMGSDFQHVGLGSPNLDLIHRALTGRLAGPVSPDLSQVDTDPAVTWPDGSKHSVAIADGTSEAFVVVRLRDADGHTVSGKTVTLAGNAGSHATITPASGVSNVANGAVIFSIKDTTPEQVTFTATEMTDGIALQTKVTVGLITRPASSGGISAGPSSVNANGSDTSTITVTLQDANGNPSPNKLVNLSQGNGSSTITGTTAFTDTTGKVQFTAFNNVTQTVTYTAVDVTDGNLPVPGSAVVNFVNASGFCAGTNSYRVGTAAAGYAVSTFASSFPLDCFEGIGPIGLAFDASGNLLVGDAHTGGLYKFGPQGGIAGPATAVGAVNVAGAGNLTGLAFTKDGRFYAMLSSGNFLLEVNPANAAVIRQVAHFDGGSRYALAVDPLSGDLFVSGFDGIERISNYASGPGTVTHYTTGDFDGIVFAPDGTLYAAATLQGAIYRITGTNSQNPGTRTAIVFIPGSPDGLALEPNAANPAKPTLFVNRNDGTITRVDTSALPDTPVNPCGGPCTDIYTGGSRGDFVTVAPGGCLYATQSERIIRITKADGACSLLPSSAAPELALTPENVQPSPAQGATVTLTATLRNVSSPGDIPITLFVGGANPVARLARTDANGKATLTYAGVFSGTDQVFASANVSGGTIFSNNTNVTWTAGKHSTFLTINQSPTSGVTNQPLIVTANLVDISVSPPAPVSGVSVGFTLGGQSCNATTSSTGTASCSITTAVAPGAYSLSATFAATSTLLASSASKTLTLIDAVSQPTVQFSSANYSVQEDCTTLTITVNRIGDSSAAVTVDYSTLDGSATERKDYISALGKIQFGPGETSKTFAVLINEDSYVEGNETFTVNLGNPSGIALGVPATATVTIIDDAAEPATNVIDDPRNFVCQNYHDFLNRQPDTSGWDFWTNQITSCGTDANCIEVKRINVSAAFFLSIEFQQTGYLVERIYKVAYGDATGTSTSNGSHQLAVPVIRSNEFLKDTQRIGQGVIVLQPGWEQALENNKQAFASEFVATARFITAFPTAMTPTQFVDKLNQNAGNVLSTSERTAAINLFGSASDSSNLGARTQALRQVAEDQDLSNAEFNRAFVLMQYLGYLRRNPNDPQDTDHSGWEFWLNKLNQFNGNYINAEMVKAFISSIEYRQRFGP